MSNIQPENFYQEAENMQSGWGEYLRSIDELKDKVDCNEDITIHEACFVLWSERLVSSSIYLAFKKDMDSFAERKMPWPAWHGMFDDWSKRNENKEIKNLKIDWGYGSFSCCKGNDGGAGIGGKHLDRRSLIKVRDWLIEYLKDD